MTALIIIAAVIAVILILLYFPLTVELSFLNNNLTLRVKYLIFTFFSIPAAAKKPPKKRKKPRRSRKSEKHTGEAAETENSEISVSETAEADEADVHEEDDEDIDLEGEKPKKQTLSDKLDFVKEKKRQITLIWQLCKKQLGKIIKNIAADRINIDITAAGEDAYSAAVLYGGLNAAVWNAVAVTTGCMNVKYDSVSIKADFNSETPVYKFSARIKITPAVVAGNVIAAAFKLLLNLKKIRTSASKN